ncbi:MAG: efflux transporter outer membrane subunit [Hyphomonadaceae bacterium]
MRHRSNAACRLAPALIALAGLAGCSTMPRERPAPPPLPEAWTEAVTDPAQAELVGWWEGFNDPLLDQLIAEGLTRSPSVRQAVLRVKEARGQGWQTVSGYLPEFSATGRGQYTRALRGPGLYGSTIAGFDPNAPPTPEQEQAIGSYGASVSWEIPLFSRVEAAAIGAKANTRAALADVRGARAALAADVAEAYVALRAAQNRRAALREGADIARALAEIVRVSADAGFASEADAADALRQAETTKAALSDVEIAARQAANQLAVLRAHAPGTEEAAVAEKLAASAPVPTIALSAAPAAPADLVRLRPDVAVAEAQAIVAAAAVGAARTDLLPHLSLTGTLLASENVLGAALPGPTTQAQLQPAISIPLLDWGKRFAAIRASKSRFQQALIGYESAVIQGVSEASLALTQLSEGQRRLEAARRAEAAAARTAEGFRASYSAGIASLADRLRSDQQLLDARLTRIQAETAAASAAIGVYRAFGGGPPDIADKSS